MTGWIWVQRLQAPTASSPAHRAMAAHGGAPARRLHITRRSRCSSPTLVDVPTVIGWLKPVVLLPASALSRPGRPDRSKRFWRTNWRTSAGTTIWSTCCRRSSRRCCSITPRCGGCRGGSASSARTAATTSRSACAAIRSPTPSALADLEALRPAQSVFARRREEPTGAGRDGWFAAPSRAPAARERPPRTAAARRRGSPAAWR